MLQNNIFGVATGISGALAVALGAYGAHGLSKSTDAMRDTWKVKNIT